MHQICISCYVTHIWLKLLFFAFRKLSLTLNCILGLVGSLVAALCVPLNNAIVLFVGRFISGLNAGVTIGVASMYLTEIAPQNLRGMIGACHQLAVTGGICISYFVTWEQALGTGNLWAYGIGVGVIPCGLGLILLPMCPESARWMFLIRKNEEGAKAAFLKVSGESSADAFVKEMKEEVAAANAQPEFKVSYLFTKKEYSKPTAIAILIQVLQQLSGINAVSGVCENISKSTPPPV